MTLPQLTDKRSEETLVPETPAENLTMIDVGECLPFAQELRPPTPIVWQFQINNL